MFLLYLILEDVKHRTKFIFRKHIPSTLLLNIISWLAINVFIDQRNWKWNNILLKHIYPVRCACLPILSTYYQDLHPASSSNTKVTRVKGEWTVDFCAAVRRWAFLSLGSDTTFLFFNVGYKMDFFYLPNILFSLSIRYYFITSYGCKLCCLFQFGSSVFCLLMSVYNFLFHFYYTAFHTNIMICLRC